jgi:hypothetical protein
MERLTSCPFEGSPWPWFPKAMRRRRASPPDLRTRRTPRRPATSLLRAETVMPAFGRPTPSADAGPIPPESQRMPATRFWRRAGLPASGEGPALRGARRRGSAVAEESRRVQVCAAVFLLAVGSAASTGVSRPPLTAPNKKPSSHGGGVVWPWSPEATCRVDSAVGRCPTRLQGPGLASAGSSEGVHRCMSSRFTTSSTRRRLGAAVGPAIEKIPASMTLHSMFPSEDGSQAVCVWEAGSVGDVRSFVGSVTGDLSRDGLRTRRRSGCHTRLRHQPDAAQRWSSGPAFRALRLQSTNTRTELSPPAEQPQHLGRQQLVGEKRWDQIKT